MDCPCFVEYVEAVPENTRIQRRSEAGINDGQKNKSQKGVGVCKCIVDCTENLPVWQSYVYRNRFSSEKLEVVQEYNHNNRGQGIHFWPKM